MRVGFLASVPFLLLLLVLSVLVLANEVRFQGCVARQDRALAITADHPDSAVRGPECARLPFAA